MTSIIGDGAFDVYGQFFEANGEKRGSEFQVNDVTAGTQHQPEAVEVEGGVLIVFTESRDGGYSNIVGKFAPNPNSTDLPIDADSWIEGHDGDDTITGGDGIDNIRGGTGDDQIDGGKGDDIIRGNDGDDTIDGGEGDDELRGGSGNDVIRGGQGDDTIFTGDGDTQAFGEDGDDTIYMDGPERRLSMVG